MRITKVANRNGRVYVEWAVASKTNAESEDKFSLNTDDEALQSFYDAFNRLAPFVGELCEFPQEYLREIEVRSLSLTYKEGVMAATLSAVKTLENSQSPFNIHTPLKPSAPYSEGFPENVCMSKQCKAAIENLLAETRRYINGERSQGDLFAPGSMLSEDTAGVTPVEDGGAATATATRKTTGRKKKTAQAAEETPEADPLDDDAAWENEGAPPVSAIDDDEHERLNSMM